MTMSEIEKAAVLLIALGPQRSQRILDQLGTDELLPIIEAMQRMKHIDPTVRRQVLLEVVELLENLSTGNKPTSPNPLFQKLGPYLPKNIDAKNIDWDRAGFRFDPPDDPPPNLPSGGRR